jgi:hypothetical protein
VVQQLREAFPYDSAPRYLILDRDGKYGDLVPNTLRSWGVKPVKISRRSPWQNGVAERWVLSVRRELIDHVVVLNKAHLQRLLKSARPPEPALDFGSGPPRPWFFGRRIRVSDCRHLDLACARSDHAHLYELILAQSPVYLLLQHWVMSVSRGSD